MSQTARIELPPKLLPVFDGEADVRGAYGGRGSGKTRSFAKMSAVRAYMWASAGRNGQILCGRQFMKTLADSSLEEVKQAILETDWLKPFFDIGVNYIRTQGLPGDVYYTFMGLDRNIDSVKSQARILLGWVDEAEPVTDEAWTKLIPTLREEDSELWVTWNPERKNSATHNYADIVSERRPHQWEGNSIPDDVIEIQKVKTVLLRQTMDNLYWQNNLQPIVQEGQIVDMSAVTQPEFGKPIRVNQGIDVRTAVGYNIVPMVADKSFNMLSPTLRHRW